MQKFDKSVWVIISLFLIAKLFSLSYYKTVWWDSAAYIGMGKYIYSLGKLGLWEQSRPIIWPLILGLFWKLGFNPVIAGRLLEIIFASLSILLVYIIGIKLFNKDTAFLASAFLAFSPSFFFFSGIMLTEVTSTFFSLAAIYFFTKERFFISGILLGMASLTRFLQLFVFIAVIISILISGKKNINHNKNKAKLAKILAGFAVASAPFLILNYILYGNAFFPFLQQVSLSKNSGWFNYHPISYYFLELFKENFLYLLSIFAGFLIIKGRNRQKIPLAAAFFLFFIFFNSIQQKEMRFLIVMLPFMYLLLSFFVAFAFNKSKNKIFKAAILTLVIASFVFCILNISSYYRGEFNKGNQYLVLQNNLGDYSVKGKIWVSNPIFAAFSDKKIDKLMYYPAFNFEKKKELIKDSDKADFIFFDSCDLACKPFDLSCEENRNDLIEYFKQNLNSVYSLTVNQCEQYIFKKWI